jgi:hypothetical protein
MEIIKLLSAVMEDAGAVRKSERNTHQNFNFRGIDAVVNAVSPALRKHGVVVLPTVNECIYETVVVGQNKTAMGHIRLDVTYAFYAPDGSTVSARVSAESMDSGDKATAKAMSVAFRTALLQVLCLPTDDTDPDASTYERSPSTIAPKAAKAQIGMKVTKVEQGYPAQEQHSDDGGNKLVTENQIKMMFQVLKQIDGDETLLHELAGKASVKELTVGEASKVIEQLLLIKRGEASINFDRDGNLHLTREA